MKIEILTKNNGNHVTQ